MKKLMMAVMVAGMMAAALADVSFSYSGQLRNETGGAVSEKNPTITFSLYNVATGGTALWSRMIPVLLDANGYFAVELSNANGSTVGTETKLEDVLANNANLYIGLNVQGSSGEISPRQKLLSTPRAAFAEDVKTAKNGFTVNGAAVFVNGLQIGSGTSATAEIKSDGTISAKKLTVPTVSGDTSVDGALNATTVKQGGNVLIPKGVIVMWSGAVKDIPAGWALCDGSAEGRPDLRGKFIVGASVDSGADTSAGKYEVGNNGGSNYLALNADNLPEHYHVYWSFLSPEMLGRTHLYDSVSGKQPNLSWPELCKFEPSSASFHFSYNGSGYRFSFEKYSESMWIHRAHTSNTGSNKPTALDNRPPYYALCYIIKL